MKTVFGTFCLALLVVFTSGAAAYDAPPILLRGQVLTPEEMDLRLADLSEFAGSHVLLQMEIAPAARERDALANRGIRLLRPVPNRAYVAYIEERDWSAERSLAPLRWIGRLTPEMKMHPRVLDGYPDVHAVDENGLAVFDVTCHADISRERCVMALEDLGARVLGYADLIHLAHVHVDPVLAFDIAELDEVLWIAEPTPDFGVFNDQVRPAIGADLAYEAPYFINGTGVRVLVYDGGYILTVGGDAMHEDLRGRLLIGEALPQPDLIGHATHVACTIAGTGAASGGQYMGMAPGAMQIVSMAYSTFSEPIFYNNVGDMERNYRDAIQEYGVQVANNSIGANIAANDYDCAWEGDYEGSAAAIDAIIAGEYGPVILVWANGNERGYGRCGSSYGTVPPPVPAKNTIAVGATVVDNDAMTTFSSWGPTDDGRMRPDVVAPGDSRRPLMGGTMSCSYFSLYLPMAGTSQAAPAVTGAVTLALEMWNREMGPEDPSAALMKALVIHGARDLGRPGPDYEFGFGIVQVPEILDAILERAFREITLDQGETRLIRLRVNGLEAVKVTLVWSDPPGPPLSGRDLVNDLNLSVTTPEGQERLPFLLNPADPGLAATRGIDSVNPAEQVLIESAQEGIYEIYVDGFAVPEGPQEAALVITGGEICEEEEICDNGIDDNCDGEIDEGCDSDDDDDASPDGDDDDDDDGCCG